MKLEKVFAPIKSYIERKNLAIFQVLLGKKSLIGLVILITLLGILFIRKPTIQVTLSVCYFPGHTSKNLPEDGFLPLVVKESFSKTGIEVVFQYFNYPIGYFMASKGIFDGTLGYHKFKEHEHLFEYSKATFENDIVFFHLKKNKFSWNTLDDLEELRIGADDHRQVYKEYPLKTFGKDFINKGLNIKYLTNPVKNMDRLYREEIDIYPIGLRIGNAILKDHFPNRKNNFTHHPKVLNTKNYHYLLLSKKLPENKRKALLRNFDKGFEELKKSGRLAEILKTYKI